MAGFYMIATLFFNGLKNSLIRIFKKRFNVLVLMVVNIHSKTCTTKASLKKLTPKVK